MTKKRIHIIGTGTIGLPLVGLFTRHKKKFDLEEITFHKNTPLKHDISNVKQLLKTGAKLTTDKEKFQAKVAKSHKDLLNALKEETVMSKYLETKKDSLEESILGVWASAAEKMESIKENPDGRTKVYKSHRTKLEAARLRRENKKKNVDEATGDKEAYQKFFNKALKKFGVKSPSELKGDKEKEFYDYVDKNWKADHEESVKKRII